MNDQNIDYFYEDEDTCICCICGAEYVDSDLDGYCQDCIDCSDARQDEQDNSSCYSYSY